jgi:hypothetical protein
MKPGFYYSWLEVTRLFPCPTILVKIMIEAPNENIDERLVVAF